MDCDSRIHARLNEYTSSLINRSVKVVNKLVIMGPTLLILIGFVFGNFTIITADESNLHCGLIMSTEDIIQDLYWSRDSQFIVAQHYYQDLQELNLTIWNVEPDQVPYHSEPSELPLMWSPTPAQIAWSQDGTQVAYRQHDVMTIKYYLNDLQYEIPAISRTPYPYGVAWSHDGRFLAVDQNSRWSRAIQIWEASKGTLYWEIQNEWMLDSYFAWHPFRNWFVIPHTWQLGETEEYGLQVFDVETKATIMDFKLPSGYLDDYQVNLLYNPLWSADGQFIIADFDMVPFSSVMWNTKTLEMKRTPFSDMRDWDIYENRLAIATNNSFSSLEVWDIASEERITEFDLSALYVAWSPSGDYLSVATSHQIYVCQVKTETQP